MPLRAEFQAGEVLSHLALAVRDLCANIVARGSSDIDPITTPLPAHPSPPHPTPTNPTEPLGSHPGDSAGLVGVGWVGLGWRVGVW